MKTFDQLGLIPELVQAVTDLGFVYAMPVQEKVIPHLLSKHSDVVALAQTGTGKTAAFGLPTLQRLDCESTATQALILDPTRELCLQTCSDLQDYAKHMPDVKIQAVYGGANIDTQIKAVKRGAHIIVATPGRLMDLMRRNVVDLSKVSTVVLDEADEMLNMGFVDDINFILEHVPLERKMLLFSATMPAEIAQIAARFMHEPQEFVVGTKNVGAENVKHIYYMVKASDKYLALKRIVDYVPRIYGIVFCRTRASAKEIAEQLIHDGYNADALHGDLTQPARDMVMKKFREHNLQLLVATDVAARGIDVEDLTHIISYSLPDDNDVYIHRSGRTGRAGKSGTSIAIIHSRERGKLKAIEKQLGKPFERQELPKPKAIIEKQLFNLADRLERIEVQEENIAPYLPGIAKKLSWLTADELLKRLLSMEFNRLLSYYENAPELDYVPDKAERPKSRGDREKDSRKPEKGFERIYINVGKAHGFYAPDLIRLINSLVAGPRVGIGRIDLLANYSLFDVHRNDAKRVIKAVKNADFYGTRLYLEVADDGKDYAALSEKTAPAIDRKERRRRERELRDADNARHRRRTANKKTRKSKKR